MIDDKKAIKDSLNGNHQAFAILVDRYKSFVCSLAYCVTGSVDTSEDIAQDVFISVWKDLPTLKDSNKFRSWLKTITHNKTCTHIRKGNTQPKCSNVDMGQVAAKPNKSTDLEENASIWQTLESLPAKYREVMVLYYRHEKSAKQVAALLEITPDAVRQRLSRGREMLRVRMEDKLEAGLRSSAPGKKFTASVITAISSIPVGVAVSEAAVSTAASSPIAAISGILTATATKVAIVLVAAVAITAGIILNNKQK